MNRDRLRRLGFLFALAASIFGCVTRVQSRYAGEWESKKQHWLTKMISLRCPAPLKQQTCGVISEDFYRELPGILSACHEQNGDDKVCSSRALDALFSRFKLRYEYADWERTSTWCTANPSQCNFSTWYGAGLFELELIRTHNEAVASLASQEHDIIQQRGDIDALQSQHALSNALSHMGDGLIQQSQSPNVNCISTTSNGFVQTHCH